MNWTVGGFMRKVISFSIIILFVLMAFPSSLAKPAVDTETGPVFGGQFADVNNLTQMNNSLSSLPAIAEDFTATWCGNCVKVEHALDDLEQEGLLQKYEFHMYPDVQEEDPFGSEGVMQYIDARYNTGAPPLVAINGTIKKEGSYPESDSLADDYRNMMNNPLELGDGMSNFTWTPKESCNCDLPDNMGLLAWDLDVNLSAYPDASLNVHAWIVETSAEFADGSNGQGTYRDIVRQITDLGTNAYGTAEIVIPEPYDGDDLEIHLMYVITLPDIVEETIEEEKNKEESALPGFGIVLTLIAALSAAAIIRRE